MKLFVTTLGRAWGGGGEVGGCGASKTSPRSEQTLKKIGKRVFSCIENYFKANIYYFQASIELEATELKDKATDVEEALAEVEGFLERLKDLAKEVQ